jgi:hypothetical protein
MRETSKDVSSKLRKPTGTHFSDRVSQRSHQKILRPYSVQIDSGSDDNQT